MPHRVLANVKIVDIQKRKVPSKHYVYVINVTWSDGSVNVIYRRYSKFFDLQTKLLEEFPEESGVKDPSKRILPFLPGKIIFGRSHVRDVALRRKEPISEYCKELISLPPKISTCDTVLKFFEPKPEDIDLPAKDKDKKKKETAENISGPVMLEQYVAIADYKKQNRNEVSMVAGDIVEVIDKNENGWWFVNVDEEQGWVPAAYLEREDGSQDDFADQPCEAEKFMTTSAYKAELDDEMSFELGVIVTVLEKNFDGWWLVRYQDREGWAPAMYLKKPNPSQLQAMGSSIKRKDETSKGSVQSAPRVSESKSRKLPPRKSSVKRSEKKLPVHITNMSYERSLNLHKTLPKSPEVEYFTVGDFRSLGIEGALNFTGGESVEVVDKAPNGWWLGKIGGKEGWIPSSYLGKRGKVKTSENGVSPQNQRQRDRPLQNDSKRCTPSSTNNSEPLAPVSEKASDVPATFVALADYDGDFEGSISFKEGQMVHVIEEEQDGWSYVKIQGNEGWAPSSYLQASNSEKKTAPPRPAAPVGLQPGRKPMPLPVKPVIPASKQEPVSKKPDRPVKPQVKPRVKMTTPDVPQKPSRVETASASEKIRKLCKALETFSSGEGESLSFSKGDEFEYLEDSGSGWWLVKTRGGKQGWAPASYLEIINTKPKVPTKPTRPAKPAPPKENIQSSKAVYVAVAGYVDGGDEQCISFKEGDQMEVLEMDEGGWWLVKIGQKSGWAPSNFLKPL